MEARVEARARHFYGLPPPDLRALGKRSSEWDANDWKWDGDLFLARPLNPITPDYASQQFFPPESRVPAAGNSSNSSSSCSEEVNLGIENGKMELEKRGRVIVIEDDHLDDKANGLTLKLGGQGYTVAEREVETWEGNHGKKTKLVGGSTSRAVCQVEDCGADLSNAKDYHRRHKVCEMHSKASQALVGSIRQRFCQQCSRFHALQEFDEGKRSCRRRLAGHNKRRRKTNPDVAPNANSINDEQASSYLLISLLKILSSMHSNQPKQATDQDLLSHILRSLAGNSAGHGEKSIAGLLKESQAILNGGASLSKSEVVHPMPSTGLEGPSRLQTQAVGSSSQIPANMRDRTGGQSKMNNFDLNDAYIDSDDGMEDLGRLPVPANPGTSSLDCPSWMQQESHQSSPPQTSGTSDSASAQSPSSSSGDTQSRTDRIVFKLFGKEPNDFPLLLRAQILDWLSHSPTDIESYIRPGCVVLTLYLRQAEDAWEELRYDLSSSLSRLLDVSDDIFWKTGWMFIRVQNQMAIIYNGQVVVDTSLSLRSMNHSQILSIRPIAVSSGETTQFSVKGFNLCQPAARLLFAFEGKYLLQEAASELQDFDDSLEEHDDLQCVKFSCSIPSVTGRGFVEIEDCGVPGSLFPFIVAENDVCSEICMLENALEFIEADDSDVHRTSKLEAKNQALEFINEMGWMLHRSRLRSKLGNLDPCMELFSFKRFKWLVEFSMDRDWCAVVKKLLDILFDGTVGAGEHPSVYRALLEMGLVHRAVRRNCRSLVELLLRYVPQSVSEDLGSELKSLIDGSKKTFLFRPDAEGPGGLTPLHIAAGKDGSEDVLDALTNDPGMVGIQVWKSARDSTGSTPEDYARLRGHYSYIHLVQKKINKRASPAHVVLDIPCALANSNDSQKHIKESSSSFEIGKMEEGLTQQSCKLCCQKLAYGMRNKSLLYRPAMLSMVAIAAVCVCVALLFKSCPEVLYVFRPFRWELLEYGSS